jgi:hypothetical protein
MRMRNLSFGALVERSGESQSGSTRNAGYIRSDAFQNSRKRYQPA